MREDINDISCEIIAAVGCAKSSFVEVIEEAKAGNFEKADALIAKGKEQYKEGHHAHSKLLQMFSEGQDVEVNMLLVHAECQMMSAEDFQLLSQDFLDFAKKIQSDHT